MSDTTTRAVRIELSCLYCGHACAEVKVNGDERPTNRQLRDAYAGVGATNVPDWDAHGQPRCPRCRGKLFVERSEHRPIYASA